MDMNDVMEVKGHSTWLYTVILNEEGNIEVANVDMDIFDQLNKRLNE